MKAASSFVILFFGSLLSCGECSNNATSMSPTVASSNTTSTSSPTVSPTVSSTKMKSPSSNTTAKTSTPVASNSSNATMTPSIAPAPSTGGSTPVPTLSSTTLPPSLVGSNSTPAPSSGTSFPTIVSGVSYFATPKLRWSIQLSRAGPGLAQLGPGNAVTISPDGGLIYVTLNDGSLEIRKASNGDLVKTITPPANALNWAITSSSGVAFGTLQGIGVFAVYAIIDTPPTGTSEDLTSRIVAVTHPTGNLLWVSQSLPGAIQGTPVVTSTPNNFIMVTHNTNTTSATSDPDGIFSVLQAGENVTLLFSEINSKAFANDTYGPYSYGPPTVGHGPGNFPGGQLNTNDVVVWTTGRKGGKSNKGYTFAFQLPVVFQASLVHLLNTTRLNKVRWNAIARPTLSRDGQSLFVGVSEAQLRGWTNNVNFEQTAKWQQQLAQASDTTTPVPIAPILSTSETRLYAASPTPNLYGLQAATGNILWTTNLTGILATGVKVAPDDRYVYAIQPTGEVNAFDQLTGKVAWTVTCAYLSNFTNTTCRDGVEAEFSLSPTNGLLLYYGDYLGNVKALQLGTLLAPTVAPTDYPSAVSGTGAPSAAPSAAVTSAPSAAKTHMPSHSPSKQVLAATTPAPSSSATTGTPSLAPKSSAPSASPSILTSQSPSSSPSFAPITHPTRKFSMPTSAASSSRSISTAQLAVAFALVMVLPTWVAVFL